jgi:hypothetical protein
MRVIISENRIQCARTIGKTEFAAADRLAVIEICNLLNHYKIPYRYNDREGGYWHTIYCNHLATPVEFTADYLALTSKYIAYNIDIRHNADCIKVENCVVAPLVEVIVTKRTPILIALADDETSNPVDVVEVRPEDRLVAFRARLSDNIDMRIFDIYTAGFYCSSAEFNAWEFYSSQLSGRSKHWRSRVGGWRDLG